MIEAYLAELAERLHVPARTRRRIVHEARDHLLEMAARGRERGLSQEDAEREALESFGAAEAVASEFHEQLATAGAHRSSSLTAALVLAFLGLMAVINGAPGGSGADWASGGGYSLVAFFLGQVAVVAGALGVARSLRYRGERLVPADRLVDVQRANAVALGCVSAVEIALAIGLALHANSLGGSAWTIALTVAFAAVAGLALAATISIARLLAAARPLAPAASEADALDDLLALARLVPDTLEPRAPGLAARAGRLGSRAAAEWGRLRGKAPRLAAWLDLRSHPWRFCAVFGAACGLALAIAHGVTDGGAPAPGELWRALLATLLIASIEAAAVALAFLALGRYLGIRR